jgi:hypothetical protein
MHVAGQSQVKIAAGMESPANARVREWRRHDIRMQTGDDAEVVVVGKAGDLPQEKNGVRYVVFPRLGCDCRVLDHASARLPANYRRG